MDKKADLDKKSMYFNAIDYIVSVICINWSVM